MNPGILILFSIFAIWFLLTLKSINRPQLLFLVSVALISFTNFSFFGSELLSRFAIPDALLITLFGIYLFRIAFIQKEEIIFPKSAFFIFLVFLTGIFLSFLSLIPDQEMLYGGGEFLIILQGILVFFLGAHYVKSEQQFAAFLKAWMISVLLTSIVCVIDMGDMVFAPPVIEKLPFAHSGFFGVLDVLSQQSFIHDLLSPWPSRIMGPFRSNGQLASYALTSFFVMLAYLHIPDQTRGMKRLLVVLIWCLGIFAFLSMALRVLPSLFAGTVLYTIFAFRRSAKNGFFVIGLIVAAVLLIASIAALNPQLVPSWARDLNMTHTQSKTMGSAPLRAWALPSVWAAFTDHPLSGIGFGRFIQSDYINLTRGFEIHSTPLQFLAETGLVGFFSYLLLMLYFGYLAFRNLLLSKSGEWKDFFLVLSFGVLSLPISYLYNRHLKERTFWLLLILIYAAYRFLSKRYAATRSSKIV